MQNMIVNIFPPRRLIILPSIQANQKNTHLTLGRCVVAFVEIIIKVRGRSGVLLLLGVSETSVPNRDDDNESYQYFFHAFEASEE